MKKKNSKPWLISVRLFLLQLLFFQEKMVIKVKVSAHWVYSNSETHRFVHNDLSNAIVG